jgi:hypothetical protein
MGGGGDMTSDLAAGCYSGKENEIRKAHEIVLNQFLELKKNRL